MIFFRAFGFLFVCLCAGNSLISFADEISPQKEKFSMNSAMNSAVADFPKTLTVKSPVKPFEQADKPVKISSQQLLSSAKKMHGRAVVIQGEVIGDIMRRSGNWAWINVGDEGGVIGVLAPQEMVQRISSLGDYRHEGDVVSVVGVFYRKDPLSNGDLFIRAQCIEILKLGYKIERVLHPEKIKVALIFLLITICSILLRVVIKRKADNP